MLEKTVHSRTDSCVLPQPFPYLFLDVKRDFLESRGERDVRYPLGHLFREPAAEPEFREYLRNTQIAGARIRKIFEAMRKYTGCHFPQQLGVSIPDRTLDFCGWYEWLVHTGAAFIDSGKTNDVIGSKEVFCEEYLPYLCSNGINCLVIIRDPRAILGSVRGDSSQRYVDSGMSILHVIRQWRKSVAISKLLENEPAFNLVRFESLVESPDVVLDEIRDWLGEPAGWIRASTDEMLIDQFGNAWRGNSSFGEKGRRKELPEELEELVEILCGPEMRLTGYIPRHATAIDDAERTRKLLLNHGVAANNVESELKRLAILYSGKEPNGVINWFIDRSVFRQLQQGAGST